jgi:hypothetical protein
MTFFPVNTGFNCDKGHGYSQYNEKNEERASRGGGVAHITPEVAAALSLRIPRKTLGCNFLSRKCFIPKKHSSSTLRKILLECFFGIRAH